LAGAPSTEIYGPFEVLERLGTGGMATVHRAIERGIEGFERVVALKRLLLHLAEDEDFVRAFVREAKLASLLQHGNIVKLFELGRVGSSYFISMEYIPGRDLRVILRQSRRVCGPPPVEIALAILAELLDALDCAHNQRGPDGKPLGLVHRDISPSNLIISHTGHLKVIDFGIAKATLSHFMTHTGRIKGKLSYMAPEALAGRLDGRSDLFSASVIAHELLTATPLFAAKEDLQIIERLQNMKPPPPSAKNPHCPPELDDIVLRGLAKDPAQRWRSAAEMRGALAQLAIDQHLLATNFEVSHWVEEAFEKPPPSRLRLPLSAPPGHASESRRSSTGDASDDEVMDIVWGVTGPRSPMAVVLDEVPDVSSRFSRISDEYPVSERLRLPDLGQASRQHTPSAPRPSYGLPGSSGLVPAPAATLAPRRRSSVVPLLIAAVAVAGAGAAIGWAVSGGRGDAPAQTAAAPTATPAAPPAAAPGGQLAPATTAAPTTPLAQPIAPAVQPPPADVLDTVAAEPEESDPPDRDPRKRHVRREREERPRARERERLAARDADEDDRDGADRSGSERTAEDPSSSDRAAPNDTASRPSLGSPPRDISETRDPGVTRPSTTPTETPATKPTPTPAPPSNATPPRGKKPIMVAASRAKRESGSVPPIRFPPYEQAPDQISAKLCIDERGTVKEVNILSPVSPGVRATLERALVRWRYKPVVDRDEKVAACFATTFRVQVD
jgi:eukaryotic-like serine/threonine-protein kinase